MDILYFEDKYYDKLLAYSIKKWPKKPEEYLKYRLYKFPEQPEDIKRNLMVVNDDCNIVGCSLIFPTRAMVCGNEEKAFWNHDLIVDEKYRGEASLYLMMESGEIKTMFGFGATDINKKIQKELGTPCAGMARLYLLFNFWSFKVPLLRLKLLKCNKKDKLRLPERFKAGGKRFKKVDNVKEIKIPDNGYWCGPELDVEFVRDEHFLDVRFFDGLANYYFYKLENNDPGKADECYFVVRSAIEGGIPVLSIVDFRFNTGKPEQYKSVLKAASKLGRLNRFPLVTLRTSVDYKKFDFSPMIFRTDKAEMITTNYQFEGDLRSFVTNADADSDFLSLYK
jgi:hypothetical protein